VLPQPLTFILPCSFPLLVLGVIHFACTTGRIQSGKVAVGDKVKVLQYESGQVYDQLKITKIEKKAGLGKVQLQSAVAGDVVSIAGTGYTAGIADTIAAPAVAQALDPGPIDPPTLRCDYCLVYSVLCSLLYSRACVGVHKCTVEPVVQVQS
jgi:GTP-binding protein